MQPSPLLSFSGTVLGVRTVDVPAREATEGYPAREAYSYVEVDVLSDLAGYDGEVAEGVSAIQAVTCVKSDALSRSTRGERVDLLVRPYATFRRARGRSYPIAALRFVGFAAGSVALRPAATG